MTADHPFKAIRFICWITFHFQEFHSLAIRKIIEYKPKMYKIIVTSEAFFVEMICTARKL